MIRTVGELIAELEQYHEDTPVRIAEQPSYPFEHSIGGVGEADLTGGPVVYIAAGKQLGYLPQAAADVLDGF
jgi:hypothetical protein